MNKNKKTLAYIDQKTRKYIQIPCKLKNEVEQSHIENFYKSLYAMKLDAELSNKRIFKKGNTTINLIKEFNVLLDSEVLDFNGIIELFNSEKMIASDIVKVPVANFFEMFDFEHPIEYSLHELDSIIRATTKGHFQKTDTIQKTRAEMKSINPNTKLINKIGYQPTKRRNKVLAK